MKFNVRMPRHFVMMSATLAVTAWLGGCAQAPTAAVTASPAAPMAASVPAGSPAATYVGRFESPCIISNPETLSFMDVLILKPVDAKTVSVGMHKVFFSSDDCKPATQIGSLEVPTGTMVIDEQVKLGDRLVDKVTLHLPAGAVGVDSKVGSQGKGRIAIEKDTIEIHHGKDKTFSIGTIADAGTEKDLRWVDPKGHLFVGHPEQPGADGYPAALDDEHTFERR